MRSAECGSVPSAGSVVWEGVSPLQTTKGSGGASWACPAGSGAEPRPKTDFGLFWRPQNAHFCTYMTKSEGRGTICISVPRSKFWGRALLSLRDLRPCKSLSIGLIMQVIYQWAFAVAPALCPSVPPPLSKVGGHVPLLDIWRRRLCALPQKMQ